MKFYLARHAEADDGEQMDPTRGLTATGEKQVPIMADFLRTQTDKIGVVLSSEFKRGTDTADPIAKKLKVDAIRDPVFGPDGKPETAWNAIKKYAAKLDGGEVLLISHGPLINSLVAYLLESGEGDKFHFTHGGIAHFDTEEPEAGLYNQNGAEGYQGQSCFLHWMVTPKLINRLQKDDETAVIEAAASLCTALLESMDIEIHLDEKGSSYYYEEVEQKRWVLGDGGASGNCDLCEDNADRGWVDMDDVFDGADGDIDDAPAHPNCTCPPCEQRTKRVRVYESGLREDGGWVTINGRRVDLGSSAENLSDKQKRALASMNKCGASKQHIADKSEAKLSKALGVPRTPDNAPFDLRNNDIGIEIKTMVDNKNDKVTMSKAALGRKIAEKEADKLKTFTVVADVRGGGAAKYYVSDKLGSLRLGSMTPITLPNLRAMVRNP